MVHNNLLQKVVFKKRMKKNFFKTLLKQIKILKKYYYVNHQLYLFYILLKINNENKIFILNNMPKFN
ncbi:MAG: hypothetical protein A2233_01690 [Candidatus Kerfeldbacteria bacterium RIFOXYA2_FULL_38_24]|uniref:Uncharacterized protein n=1 Tax=Candidatus Kerfeldbacteria bacterium RIFOXYB2_FULL_38_14 TaxID=1798547 RepID=A0A1G2BEG7_9BACT|nr:MAG: hypothetical protein A2319_04300 [Candidatus Kerfeldbacteria bacterium RIFOXYB2_FULL_38_14]OGY87831.1 MAG: hypothetical protein A2233_01690 [Candidatus Kerfeldbacteria bacterium RIFOXYA2_FULL_38_24]OGY90540.1 MAG: hypothetical protein A2458_02125 [Candidatus Kerfeldbacteria bacterium RIFOXYC2_FULL_38_9]